MTEEEIVLKGQRLGWIYMVEAGELGPIKIGWAKDPPKRMKKLQTGHAEEMRLLGVLPGTRSLENELHRRLRQARMIGEWFERRAAMKLVKPLIAEYGLFVRSKVVESRNSPEVPKRGMLKKRQFFAVSRDFQKA